MYSDTPTLLVAATGVVARAAITLVIGITPLVRVSSVSFTDGRG
jgi:hypothetical protein